MLHKMFAIYDSKAEAYLPPIFAQTTAVAIRMFSHAATDPDHNFNRFGADYTLFELGSYDDDRGCTQMHEAKKNLGTALEHTQIDRGLAAIQNTNGRNIEKDAD